MKKIIAILLAAALLSLAGCQPNTEKTSSESSTGTGNGPLRAAFVTSDKIGGNTHLATAVAAMTNAPNMLPVETKVVETTDAEALSTAINTLVEDGYGLIVTNGSKSVEVVEKAAEKHTEVEFMVLDAVVDTTYARSATFRDEEAAYLIGMFAARMSTSNKIGSMHSSESATAKRYMWGYKMGAQALKPDIETHFAFTASYSDEARAQECVYELVALDCDFISAMCGASNAAVLQLSGERDFFVCTSDTTEIPNYEKMLTSYIKNSGMPVYDAVRAFAYGQYTNEQLSYGLKEGALGVTFVTEDFGYELSPEIYEDTITLLQDTAQRIIDGSITLLYESDLVLDDGPSTDPDGTASSSTDD